MWAVLRGKWAENTKKGDRVEKQQIWGENAQQLIDY